MFESWNDLAGVLPESCFKLAIAMLCGFALGLERELKARPAGLRTIILITVGSTLFMIVSGLLPFISDWPDATQVDPSRIASEVVSGIGFLGAGSIIQARGTVHGLTTAATIWVAAGIGLCVGAGFPLLALVITGLVLLALVSMDPLRVWLSRRGKQHALSFIVPNDDLTLARVEQVLREHDVRRSEIRLQPRAHDEVLVEVTYHLTSADANLRMLDALAHIDAVRGKPRFE